MNDYFLIPLIATAIVGTFPAMILLKKGKSSAWFKTAVFNFFVVLVLYFLNLIKFVNDGEPLLWSVVVGAWIFGMITSLVSFGLAIISGFIFLGKLFANNLEDAD